MRPVPPLLIAAATALALTACGGGEQGDAGGTPAPDEQVEMSEPDEGDAAPPLPSPDDPEGSPMEPEMREPHPDPVDVRPTEWEAAEDVNDTTLLVTYWTGVEPCAVLSHVETEETDTSVTLTLYTGRAASSEDVACIMIAVYAGVEVELDTPLGDREVRDGSVERG